MIQTARNITMANAAAKGFASDYSDILLDQMQRPLRDLRISITDRCNLRCTYCMPRQTFDANHAFLPRAELLSFEEIERLATLFVRRGVRKIRLTGGEPLLRRGVEQLVENLARLQTPQGQAVEIALTTNGVLLARMAQSLRDAGLARVTVSLDGLSDQIFKQMTDSRVAVATVLDGIAAAKAVGFDSIKVNMVVRRGINESEIVSMARHFRHSGVVLRFIEFMDVGCSNGWRMDEVVPAREILDHLSRHHPLLQIEPGYAGEVAERWGYADGAGEIGVIASVTQAFCRDCTRARLSTDGKLYTCLFAGDGYDLRTPLRAGQNDAGLSAQIENAWTSRRDRYSELRHQPGNLPLNKIEMSYIGG